jgi:predicted nucleotidyltransferase
VPFVISLSNDPNETSRSYESVEKAVLFGSRAIDTYKEASDVDIAIKGEKADWSLAITIKEHLEEETYLPFFFDVVAYGGVESEELKQHIDGKEYIDTCIPKRIC